MTIPFEKSSNSLQLGIEGGERPEQRADVSEEEEWRKQAHSVQDITEVSRLRNVGTVDVTQIRRARACTNDSI